YLTQRLCRAVAESNAGGNLQSPGSSLSQVDHLCEALFLSQTAHEQDDNLIFVRERLLRSEVDLAALLELYPQVRAGQRVKADDTNQLVGILRLAGIVRLVDGWLQVRNRIYERVFDRQWVVTHMPDAELRRQRCAFRRGLLRASGVAAVIVAALGLLSGVAFTNAAVAREQSQKAAKSQSLADLRSQRAQRLAAELQTALNQEKQARHELEKALGRV